ncbi:MAG: hypothetical protein M3Y30_12090 [Gemmatimonadota bacterium]|nr:hypothetical protein [Gemmatimonadota bacterium]
MASDDPRIARIRAWYAATEKALPTLHVVRRDLAGLSTQGAALTAYFAGDTLRKLNGTYYVENGRTTDDLYLRDDSMFYVSHIVGKFFLSVDGQLIHRVQYRMYYDHDTLLRWVDTTGKDLPVKGDAADAQVKRDRTLERVLVECAKMIGPAQSCETASGDSATGSDSITRK